MKKQITNNETRLSDIVDSINISPEKTLKVIRWLLDNGKITETKNGMLIREK